MKTKIIIYLFFLLSFNTSIAQKTVKFRGMKHEIQSIVLTASQHQELKLYVQTLTGIAPKDTICIWFHYNHSKCWASWDYMHTVKEAEDWATLINSQFDKQMLWRKKITIVQARAMGNNANKVVSANKRVVFDINQTIQKLFFKEEKNCSSSVIIYPDKSCLIIHDDPHYDFLYATKSLLWQK